MIADENTVDHIPKYPHYVVEVIVVLMMLLLVVKVA